MNNPWNVVYTRSRCEKKVAALLTKRGIENYCPLNRVVKQWADRCKLVYEPLFSSYVFVRQEGESLFKVKQATSDIVNFVYWLGKPAIINDIEISNIKDFLNSYNNVKLEKKEIHVSDHVRIINGPLKDRDASITAVDNNKVKMLVPSLGYMMIAETNIYNVEIIGSSFKAQKLVS